VVDSDGTEFTGSGASVGGEPLMFPGSVVTPPGAPPPGVPSVNGGGNPRHLPSRSEQRERRRQAEEEGYWFPLTIPTGEFARIRMLSVADRAFLGTLPDSTQKLIMEHVADLSGASSRAQADKSPEHKKAMRNLGKSDQIAKILMCYAWISPRIVMAEADLPPVEDPENPVWLADDVHPDDRIRYFSLVQSADARAWGALRTFRDGPGTPVLAQPDEQTSEVSV
jgi:hypothetical protein